LLFITNLQILLIAVILIAWVKTENVGKSVHAPQGQIKYVNSDGKYEVYSIIRC